MSRESGVIIVGAGWAGMAAALELHHHGIPVMLLEAAPQVGGRARSVRIDGITFDNGQHLLIGAYHEFLRLLCDMGISEKAVLERRPLDLRVIDAKQNLSLHAPPLPAPLHLLWALLSARGLTAAEKYRAVRMSLHLTLRGYRLERDTTVAQLLHRHEQGPEIVRRFWEPLCLATLNTPLEQASAQLFLRVLQDSFTRRRGDSDLLIPRIPLGELFCEPARACLLRSGKNRVELRTRVNGLFQQGNRIGGVCIGAERLPAEHVILAVGPEAAARLLSPLSSTAPIARQLAGFGSQPITTVYLHYPHAPSLPSAMLGLGGALSQWVFDRRLCGQPGWYAVVISTGGEHEKWTKQKLAGRVEQELARLLDNWPAKAQRHVVIRERRATFACTRGIEALRPANATPLPGLWLAGDYTDTGYPATLEGAVRSGVECARLVIAANRRPS